MSTDRQAAANHGVSDVALQQSAAEAPTVFVSARLRCRHWVAADRATVLEVYGDGARTVVFGCGLPPAFQVHLVTAANRGLLERVDDDVFDHPVRPEYVDAFLASPANLLAVAVADGTVVGMASGVVYAHPDKPLQLFVNEVGVAARFQRRGVGAAVVDALLRRGRELGCREAWVATEVGNEAARGLYRAVGAVEDDEPAVVCTFSLVARADERTRR